MASYLFIIKKLEYVYIINSFLGSVQTTVVWLKSNWLLNIH